MLTRRNLLTGVAGAAGAALACGTVLAGCGRGRAGPAGSPAATAPASASPPTDGLYFPPTTGDWATATAGEAGFRPDAFAAAMDLGMARDTVALMVIYQGRIVAERYAGGATADQPREVASVQKSVTSALLANAAAAGKLSYDQPVTRWLEPGWSRASQAQEGVITIRHLMSMSSGLSEQLRYIAPPGTRWAYNTPAYHVLHPVLEHATGESLAAWSEDTLFSRIGMTGATWQQRSPLADVAGFSLLATARQLARFGLLVLAGGRWEAAPVLPDDYHRTALVASQTDNRGYGLLWWLNSAPRKRIAAAPADLVYALGARGQRVFVLASRGLVAVRQSDDGADGFDEAWWQALMAARA